MKNESKSPDETEVTPSKKKLKQARLPFMVLSDVSPKTLNPRKRKLSDPQDETESKIGKISKENDLEDSIVISDEECTKKAEAPKEDKNLNPFVKLVDTAYKKKIQKSKASKKKKGTNKHFTCNGSIQVTSVLDTESEGNKPTKESMEVDEDAMQSGKLKNDKAAVKNDLKQKDSNVQKASETILIEDSNEPIERTTVDTNKGVPIENAIDNGCENKPNDSEKEMNVSVDSDKITVSAVTPKRSLRHKMRVDKLNVSATSSTLDESVLSTPTSPKTPRQNKSSVNDQGDESLNNSNNLTPKQVQKKIESAKKKEEREKEKLERDKKRQHEKEERARQKQEKEEQRLREKEEKEAARRKEKEEKEEQRRKEKEEKEKQKELEKRLREEKDEQKRKEREEKEEQRKKEREAREEEKRKKQEAAELEKQEQELKKKKAAQAFVNFFVPKQKVDKEERTIETSKNSMLSTFAIKSDMRLAPTTRHNISEDHKKDLENLITKQGVPESKLYLECLKNGVKKPLSCEKTWPLGDKDDDDDVVIVEDELPPMDMAGEIVTCHPVVREKLRPKLFSFHENRRPPYWGTWRKKSSNVMPRRPFGQDVKHLDYEVDSDDDWEEEAEGESLDGSAGGSDDEQGNDEYELDNEVFVPHGYLSDEEATMDEEDVLTLSPEAQKQKLKHLEEEFESELKKPTEKLKPRLYGLLWETSDGGKPENCVDALWSYFGKLAMIVDDPAPHMKPPEFSEEAEKKKVKKKKEKKTKTEKAEEQPILTVEKKLKLDSKKTNKSKSSKLDTKKLDLQKKNQPGINTFLKKLKPAT